MNYKFTVEHNGQTFECERVVSGIVVQRQTIIVNGFGTRADLAQYGKKLKSGGTMDLVARRIALELIAEHSVTQNDHLRAI